MFIKILFVVAIYHFIEHYWNIINYSALIGKRQIRTEGAIKHIRVFHTGNIEHKRQNTKQKKTQHRRVEQGV